MKSKDINTKLAWSYFCN